MKNKKILSEILNNYTISKNYIIANLEFAIFSYKLVLNLLAFHGATAGRGRYNSHVLARVKGTIRSAGGCKHSGSALQNYY